MIATRSSSQRSKKTKVTGWLPGLKTHWRHGYQRSKPPQRKLTQPQSYNHWTFVKESPAGTCWDSIQVTLPPKELCVSFPNLIQKPWKGLSPGVAHILWCYNISRKHFFSLLFYLHAYQYEQLINVKNVSVVCSVSTDAWLHCTYQVNSTPLQFCVHFFCLQFGHVEQGWAKCVYGICPPAS